jgi:hypothetical protein
VTRVVVSPYNVLDFPDGGGHFWVYMQYAQGLLRNGCDVWWLERYRRGADAADDARRVAAYLARMGAFGLGDRVLLYAEDGGARRDWLGRSAADAEAVLRGADLLLNFHYAIHPALLALPRRSALVDIDPGLLQFWITAGQLVVPPHDRYLTIGETVGKPGSRVPDCGVEWFHFRPPVCLDLWPPVGEAANPAFTTVAGWWSGEYVKGVEDGVEVLYENTKRVAFLQVLDLPRWTSQRLELALYLGDGDVPERRMFERRGWRVRRSQEVARTPEMYRSYIQGSRGEFSAAKPSCMRFQNAWVSDRTLCYLASGRPAVVQDTGPSAFLPNGEGLFRFTTVSEAAAALAAVNADYERHCRAARALAETWFDATRTMRDLLESTLR